MSTFKKFIEDISGYGGYRQSVSGFNRTAQGGLPYSTTADLIGYQNALMSPRRRQLIDVDEPGQKYFYFNTLVRSLIADVDTFKLIAGHKDDVYRIVYTKSEITKLGYAPEEQTRISDDLKVFVWTNGYDHDELVRIIGSNDLDEIKKFRQGSSFDPTKNKRFIEKEGWFVDYDKLSKIRDQLDKWTQIQGTLERGVKYVGSNLGSEFDRRISMNRLKPSPTVSWN